MWGHHRLVASASLSCPRPHLPLARPHLPLPCRPLCRGGAHRSARRPILARPQHSPLPSPHTSSHLPLPLDLPPSSPAPPPSRPPRRQSPSGCPPVHSCSTASLDQRSRRGPCCATMQPLRPPPPPPWHRQRSPRQHAACQCPPEGRTNMGMGRGGRYCGLIGGWVTASFTLSHQPPLINPAAPGSCKHTEPTGR